MSQALFTVEQDRVLFQVHVQPRASRTELVGCHGAAVKVRLQAPPVDGRANAALVAFLASTLGVSQREVEIVSGESGRSKRVAIYGLSVETIQQRLNLTS